MTWHMPTLDSACLLDVPYRVVCMIKQNLKILRLCHVVDAITNLQFTVLGEFEYLFLPGCATLWSIWDIIISFHLPMLCKLFLSAIVQRCC